MSKSLLPLSGMGIGLLITGATSFAVGFRYIITRISTAPSFVQGIGTAYFAAICGAIIAVAGIACIVCAVYESGNRIDEENQQGNPLRGMSDTEAFQSLIKRRSI